MSSTNLLLRSAQTAYPWATGGGESPRSSHLTRSRSFPSGYQGWIYPALLCPRGTRSALLATNAVMRTLWPNRTKAGCLFHQQRLIENVSNQQRESRDLGASRLPNDLEGFQVSPGADESAGDKTSSGFAFTWVFTTFSDSGMTAWPHCPPCRSFPRQPVVCLDALSFRLDRAS